MNVSLPVPLDVRIMNWTASALFVGCVLLVLAAGSSWLLNHPGFSIARIVVQGDLMHSNAVTLRANVAPHLTGNFFTVDLGVAQKAFEQVPWVRRAQVRREFPASLMVALEEHDAVAFWGPESGTAMVNRYGEVFEANVGDVELEGLPRLRGPAGSSQEVMHMHDVLRSVLEPLGLELQMLEMTSNGSWRVTFDSDAVVELGGGSPQEVLERTEKFTRTLTQVTAQYGRRVDALESADLRHVGGYALRLRGVTTVSPTAAGAAVRR